MFKEWFKIEFNSMIEDLCGYELTDGTYNGTLKFSWFFGQDDLANTTSRC